MTSSKVLSGRVIVLLAIAAVMSASRLSTNVRLAVRSSLTPIIRRAVPAQSSGHPKIMMADIPAKRNCPAETSEAPLPGLSDLRVTYNLSRVEMHESNIRVSQTIDDHWCKDFNLPTMPVGCTCWRYEYLAYFCVDWSCTNGHLSDFAMCQFLNVSWPIDPPRRLPSNEIPQTGGIQGMLKTLTEYIEGKKGNDRSLALKLLSLAKEVEEKNKKS